MRGSHVAEPSDHLRLGLDRAVEILHRILAARAHLFERGRIDIGSEAWRVDMDVAAAGRDQAFHDLALDRDDVGHKFVDAPIDCR